MTPKTQVGVRLAVLVGVVLVAEWVYEKAWEQRAIKWLLGDDGRQAS